MCIHVLDSQTLFRDYDEAKKRSNIFGSIQKKNKRFYVSRITVYITLSCFNMFVYLRGSFILHT